MPATKYYAVREGRKPGIYYSWADCKAQVSGFKGAKYKSFATLVDADAFVKGQELHPPALFAGAASSSTSASSTPTPPTPSASSGAGAGAGAGSLPSTPASSRPATAAAGDVYYGVHAGRRPGVYTVWLEAKRQITGFKKPVFRKFGTLREAEDFVRTGKVERRAARQPDGREIGRAHVSV
ncbi:hypothetical protein KEM52_003542 [Ascosphaera acerosa]|nr:hypothetical protein KEM52_003542 [Ascosphaera acerosa]